MSASGLKLTLLYDFQSCTSDGEAPDPYVKLYLLPDPGKLTKRKTKIATKTYHPTYNEMVSSFDLICNKRAIYTKKIVGLSLSIHLPTEESYKSAK